jgi:hypothetical protein
LNPQIGQITWARDVKIIEIRPINLNKSLKGSHSPQEANSDPELVLEQDRQSKINSDPELVPEQDRQSEINLNRSLREMETHEKNFFIKSIPRKFLDELIEAAAYITVSDFITYSEAINSQNNQEWQKVMETDVLNLENQYIWTLVEPLKDRKIFKRKWIYKTKLNSEGKIKRYKAR